MSERMSNEKDIAEKTLESYNDVFADIVNVLLFDGRQIVKEDELEQARSRSSYLGDKRLREQERDETKFWRKCNLRIALLGLDNQTEKDPDMPIRVIGYDGAGYRDQLYSEKDSSGNYVRNHEPRYPVITLVLYFGDTPWKSGTTLLENLAEFPEELKPFVSDYRINVFSIAFLEEETVGKFRSDFRIVADYFVQLRKNKNYKPTKDVFYHVQEMMLLMSYLTRDDRFETTYNERLKGVEYTNMCEVLDKVENRGIAKGIEIGDKRGYERGIEIGVERGRAEMLRISNLSSIRHIMDKLKYTDEQAMDLLEIPQSERAGYKKDI